MAQLPAPIRAALGLAATLTETVKDGRGLPDGLADKALEFPVLAVTAALQLSIKVQQQYAALTVRGDEVLTQLRGGAPDDPPEWARFDDEPAATPAPATPTPAPSTPATTKKATPAKKVPAKKATPAKKAGAKKAPGTKSVARKAGAKKTPATTAAAPRPPAEDTLVNDIPAPRTGRPSAFDLIGEDD
jgi:hypothetical protein